MQQRPKRPAHPEVIHIKENPAEKLGFSREALKRSTDNPKRLTEMSPICASAMQLGANLGPRQFANPRLRVKIMKGRRPQNKEKRNPHENDFFCFHV